MTDLKLGKLPDRTPVRIVIHVSPALHQSLVDYGDAYAAAYGQREGVADLIPYMLAGFIDSDRSFARRPKAAS